MTEENDLSNVPVAETAPKSRFRISVVWIIPILAALVGIGIAVQQYLNEGPTIRIAFRSAEGVEAGKTPIKYKDVEIGKVTSVTLSEDYSRILVAAKMEKSAEGLIVEDAKFWIVKPRVTLSGISGIGTILSGNYIRFEPGKSVDAGRSFTGLESPPSIPSDAPGKEFVLRADTLGSLGMGSPVYYRRLNVGRVTSYSLAADGKAVDIRIFLNAPFDGFVTSKSRFWEVSGIDVSAGAGGVAVRTESLLSLLIGGIAFETPHTSNEEDGAPDNTVFRLAGDRDTALSPLEAEADRYTLYFADSLRGLSVGASVDFLGLPVGEVTGIFLEHAPGSDTVRARVDIATYRYRYFSHLRKSGATGGMDISLKARRDLMQNQVARQGLRAQLRSASLISGQQYVALDFFPDAPRAEIDWSKSPPRFPTVPGEMTTLQAKLKGLLEKLDKVPLEEIGIETRNAVLNLDRTLRRIEGETLPEAAKAFATIDRTLTRVDGELVPEAKVTMEELRRAAAAAEKAIANADNLILSPDAPGRMELREALRETARAAKAVRLLADYLERNPSALIRGKKPEKP